jgi:hypothetical protein
VPLDWSGWCITPVTTGRNNRIYRAQNDSFDLAIKFTIPDARRRALREYRALELIVRSERQLAPTPLLLDTDRYGHPA